MNATKKMCLIAMASMTATVVGARTEDLTLWRGETLTAFLYGHAKVGSVSEGVTVKVGTAKEIRYLDRSLGTHYRTMADRVEWGSVDPGVKVVSVSVEKDVKAGVYAVGDLRITVIDRVLPSAKDWKYVLDLWQHPWAVSRFHNVEPFSSAHYAAMRPLWMTLAEAGQKFLTVTILDRPWNNQCYDAYRSMVRHVRRKDGSWSFDYRIFDEYVAFGRSCGIGPGINCFTLCPWDYAVTWEEEDGGVRQAVAVPGSAAFADYWGDFLLDFERHLRDKGWLSDTWICMDERSPDDVRNICRFVREKAPGLKIFLAGNRAPSAFEGVRIDHACFGLDRLSDKLISEAAVRRGQGMLTTYYVCCGPAYPNTMCHNQLEEAFWLGAYPAMAGLDGFLRWAWNSWPEDPMHDASYTRVGGSWKSGDTYLIYPDGSPSLRFLELRNGIVAAEKIRLLRERGMFSEEIKSLAEAFDRKAAIGNKAEFGALRKRTQSVVNKEAK